MTQPEKWRCTMSTRKVTDFNTDHPEKMKDEVYLCNCKTDFENITWKTKRKGKNAYTIEGQLIGNQSNRMYPVFVKQNEVHDKDPTNSKGLFPPV